MAIYNVHAGHCPQGQGASGAVGLLQESVEDRLVKNGVIVYLRNAGHIVYDCTVDYNTTKSGCLDGIVKMCNAHTVDLDISIHLNSGRNDYVGDGSTGGTEVWAYNNKTDGVATKICAQIADLGYHNRGVKYRQDLQVLNSTHAPAILIECAFVDDADDAKMWDADKMAQAIVKGITGQVIAGGGTPAPTPTPPAPLKDLGQVDVTYQSYTDRWWPPVVNRTDWSGKGDNIPLRYLALKVSKGSVRGRVYTQKSGWLPYLTFSDSYNTADLDNGCFGDGSPIYAVELYYYTPDGYLYKSIKYCVSDQNHDTFYSEQEDNKKDGTMDGYAGTLKTWIDKFQAWI